VPAASVTCVVVTRDRRELLRECLTAVRGQSRPVDHLVVVDNASSDGTPDLVRAEFGEAELVALARNSGATGGFHAGIVAGRRSGATWLWLLDDDTIAHPEALQRLLDAPWQRGGLAEPALLASRVDWTDGRPHPMNQPTVRRRDADGLVAAAAVGLMPLRATTWVSLLLRSTAVDRHGLPVRGYFFQADDIEYTARILRVDAGYAVPTSLVEHRTASAHDFLGDPVRFAHHLRNTLYMIRGRSWSGGERLALAFVVVDTTLRYARANRFSPASLRLVARALRDGVLTTPAP